MWCRGIRGAARVASNTSEDIVRTSEELLTHIVRANDVRMEDVGAIIFTLTPDLNAEFPARAAHRLGWNKVPLLCAQEINVPRSLPSTLRILILYNTDKEIEEIKHVYLKGTEILREENA
jgi:chorismate mutase